MKKDRNRLLPYSSRPVRDAIMAELEDALQHGNDRLRKIVRKMLDRAEEGELAWLLELFCRIEGRIPQAADVNVNVEPIKMIITGVPRPGDHAKLVNASAAPQVIPDRKRQPRIPVRPKREDAVT